MLFLVPIGSYRSKALFLDENQTHLWGCLALPTTVLTTRAMDSQWLRGLAVLADPSLAPFTYTGVLSAAWTSNPKGCHTLLWPRTISTRVAFFTQISTHISKN